MTQFSYRAVNAAGEPVSGSIEAVDWPSAVELLTAQGLRDCQLADEASGQTPGSTQPPGRVNASASAVVLGSADALELATYLSELAAAGLPLGAGLSNLGHDAASPALRRVIE
jgi:type II secretory pathway component PulF